MKIFKWIAYIIILLAIGLMLLVGYWLLYPYKPIVYKDEIYPILNENKTATVGGILSYQVNYCKYVKTIPTVLKRYVDGIMFDTPGSRGIVIQGCHSQQVDNVVPETLPPGKYYMDIVVDYEVNPIRHMIYNNKTEQFTIVAAE